MGVIGTAKYADTDNLLFGAVLSDRNGAMEGVDEIIAPIIATEPTRALLNRAYKVCESLTDVLRRVIETMPIKTLTCGIVSNGGVIRLVVEETMGPRG